MYFKRKNCVLLVLLEKTKRIFIILLIFAINKYIFFVLNVELIYDNRKIVFEVC